MNPDIFGLLRAYLAIPAWWVLYFNNWELSIMLKKFIMELI